jgi:macrolide transport system ATP-binding/permease protein
MMISKIPLIKLRNIYKNYKRNETQVNALRDISLDIFKGDFVAIVGSSGSGKTTLMNLIGCLDLPSEGNYYFEGININEFTLDQKANFRRERIGFIFQGYQLLNQDDILNNVTLPARYSHQPSVRQFYNAVKLLSKFGLNHRLHNYPTQLSGGEQQRVAIARALMNGGQIVLADEPTGALDGNNAKRVIELLRDLSIQGHTIILITHDLNVASQAARIIELSNGCIVKDERKYSPPRFNNTAKNSPTFAKNFNILHSVKLALFIAWGAIWARSTRTLLTISGIVVGVASLMLMIAIGEGARQSTLDEIGALGARLVKVVPGSWGESQSISQQLVYEVPKLFSLDLLKVIEKLDRVDAAAPVNSYQSTVTSAFGKVNTTLIGTSNSYQKVAALEIISGRFINSNDIIKANAVIVLDENSNKQLWPNESAINKWVMLSNNSEIFVPMQVVGVVKNKDNYGNIDSSEKNLMYLPLTTASMRFHGDENLGIREMHILAPSFELLPNLKFDLQNLIFKLRGKKDFTLIDMVEIIKANAAINDSMNLLLTSLSILSLVVAGVSLMNMQLVSVIERTQEIGIRIAVGAQKLDIQLQFLIEAILIGFLGGIIGIIFGLLFTYIAKLQGIVVHFSTTPALMGLISATAVALFFGWYPASKASLLQPAQALSQK